MGINQREVKNLLQKEDPVILEVGAHKGEDTINFLKEFKDIRIYCFEPDPRCIAEFKKNIQDDRCTLIEAAVSNENGKARLHISTGWPVGIPGLVKVFGLTRCYVFAVSIYRRIRGRHREWDGSSSIKKSLSYSEDLPWLTFNKNLEVKTIRLDTFTEENSISFVDFIWSDVQGAEKDMVEGGIKTLNKTKYLYTEYGWTSCYPDAMTRQETVSLLQKCDFEIIPEYSDKTKFGDLLFVNRKFKSSNSFLV